MNNLETNRFVLGNEVAKEALIEAKTGYKTLKEQLPGVAGMTVFGSMVKGYAKESSDLDGFIFLDSEAINVSEEDVTWGKSNIFPGIKLHDAAAVHKYKEGVQSVMLNSGLSSEQVSGIRIKTISKNEIIDELDKELKYQASFEDYINSKYQYSDEVNTSTQEPETNFMDRKISALFHLQIGHDLDKYRGIVLTHLEGAGKSGEKVWKQVIMGTADIERDMKGSNYEHLYPQTISEARNYFNLKE